jgi:hypothetical protein
MFTTSLTAAELETVIVALKYWRSHRAGIARRGDRPLTPFEFDVLLAKLGAPPVSSLPPDEPMPKVVSGTFGQD